MAQMNQKHVHSVSLGAIHFKMFKTAVLLALLELLLLRVVRSTAPSVLKVLIQALMVRQNVNFVLLDRLTVSQEPPLAAFVHLAAIVLIFMVLSTVSTAPMTSYAPWAHGSQSITMTLLSVNFLVMQKSFKSLPSLHGVSSPSLSLKLLEFKVSLFLELLRLFPLFLFYFTTVSNNPQNKIF